MVEFEVEFPLFRRVKQETELVIAANFTNFRERKKIRVNSRIPWLRFWDFPLKTTEQNFLHGFPGIIARMDIPLRFISDLELRRQNGERGTRKFVAYKGVVYDVTDCPKWRLDLHENLHFAGQDLTSELPDAPHEEDVFTRPCVKVVGRLES